MSSKILIIEDDRSLSDMLSQSLGDHGFKTEQCFDGLEGLTKALQGAFDLILMDVMLPSMSGFNILSQLRKTLQTPVILLTAHGAEEDRIEGYSKGADDYVPKPFNLKELLLRIDAVMRRVYKPLGKEQGPTSKNRLEVDDLVLKRNGQEVTLGDKHLEFTPIQFRLLWFLIENQNEVLSKPLLYQTILGKGYSCYDRSLDIHLSRIRRKLKDAGFMADRLITVHGKGYSFC